MKLTEDRLLEIEERFEEYRGYFTRKDLVVVQSLIAEIRRLNDLLYEEQQNYLNCNQQRNKALDEKQILINELEKIAYLCADGTTLHEIAMRTLEKVNGIREDTYPIELEKRLREVEDLIPTLELENRLLRARNERLERELSP